MNIIIIIAFLITLSFTLLGCEQERPQNKAPRLIHAKLGEYDLYIPKEYVRFGYTSIGTEAALIQAWYPGANVVPGKIDDLWEQGEWWKSVRILINLRKSAISFDEFSRKSTKSLDATEFVGEEHGLVHMTQPDGKVKDKYDIWREMKGEEIVSYITCTEKILETDRPQCSHHFFAPANFWVTVSYNKKLLPEWKTIQTNVLSMIQSFNTYETSKDFIKKRL